MQAFFALLFCTFRNASRLSSTCFLYLQEHMQAFLVLLFYTFKDASRLFLTALFRMLFQHETVLSQHGLCFPSMNLCFPGIGYAFSAWNRAVPALAVLSSMKLCFPGMSYAFPAGNYAPIKEVLTYMIAFPLPYYDRIIGIAKEAQDTDIDGKGKEILIV